MIESNIRNIIFDLGGVILDLSVESTMRQLAALSGLSPDAIIEKYKVQPAFTEYECGNMTDNEFRDAVRGIFNIQCSDADIDKCWNAMLGGIPVAKIEMLRQLKSKYRTYLLSNTNAIHLSFFSNMVARTHSIESLDPLFHKTYYSHVLRMRKPHAPIYEHVLRDNNLKAEETVFLDDNLANLEGAASVGIKTIHIHHPDHFYNIFK